MTPPVVPGGRIAGLSPQVLAAVFLILLLAGAGASVLSTFMTFLVLFTGIGCGL